jgi:predicted amidohydrolase
VSPRTLPVAAIQPNAHDRNDFKTIWPRVLRLANDAAERGAKLIVLPEGTVPAYVLGTEPVHASEIGGANEDLQALASRYGLVIVYGGVKIANGAARNAAICIGPDGAELGYAAKQFLWHFDRRWFTAGQTLQPIETPLGTLGLLVCADGRIPTIAATLVERGAQALVMPTAWVTSGRDPEALENLQADLLANVRARENGVPFVIANKCGVERASVAYCGKSAIVAASGEFVARGSETREEIVWGEIELARRGRTRADAAMPHVRSSAEELSLRARLRIAFTAACDPAELAGLAAAAAVADCDLIVSGGPLPAEITLRAPAGAGVPLAALLDGSPSSARGGVRIVEAEGLRFAAVADGSVLDPRGLVDLRLHGIDLFVWRAGAACEPSWRARFARTRAAELRAFVIVFESDGEAGRERAFAVDPDGAVVAGTYGDFRLASFVYDRARAAATTVAPATDVLAGLRVAEAIRERELAGRGAHA